MGETGLFDKFLVHKSLLGKHEKCDQIKKIKTNLKF